MVLLDSEVLRDSDVQESTRLALCSNARIDKAGLQLLRGSTAHLRRLYAGGFIRASRVLNTRASGNVLFVQPGRLELEEHYWDKELSAQFVGGEGVRDPDMLKRLYDLGELRLKEMDEAGIDMQILSHGAPSAQKLSGPDAVALTRRVNDRLHAAVQANPKRFGAFAAL
ncbi:MAG: hypothetical protein E6G96_20925, partial [Alphaproteobacteria bacterium]